MHGVGDGSLVGNAAIAKSLTGLRCTSQLDGRDLGTPKCQPGLEQALVDRPRTPEHLVNRPGDQRWFRELFDARGVGAGQRLGEGVSSRGELGEGVLVERIDARLEIRGC